MNGAGKHEVFKVVLVGEAAVGKSSVMRRATRNEFAYDQSSTIGADFGTFDVTVQSTPVRLQLWDTAGQEKYHSLSPSYFRYAHGVFLVYSITDDRTLNVLKMWMNLICRLCEPNVVLILLANKCDLMQAEQTAEELLEHRRRLRGCSGHDADSCKDVDIAYYCSAKDGRNINEAFTRMAQELLTKRRQSFHNLALQRPSSSSAAGSSSAPPVGGPVVTLTGSGSSPNNPTDTSPTRRIPSDRGNPEKKSCCSG